MAIHDGANMLDARQREQAFESLGDVNLAAATRKEVRLSPADAKVLLGLLGPATVNKATTEVDKASLTYRLQRAADGLDAPDPGTNDYFI